MILTKVLKEKTVGLIKFSKTLAEATTRRFRSEELFFGGSMILTILSNNDSIVPDLAVMVLLAFYYFFFGWMILSTKTEKHIIFSILSGIGYSICLVSMTVMEIDGKPNLHLVLLQALIALAIFFYLKKKSWGIYKENHYTRIGIIIFLNLLIFSLRIK